MPDTSDTSATQMQHEWHKQHTSKTRVRHKRHESTQEKNFDFDNYISENIFSHPCIYYMASKRLQGEEQFQAKSYVLEMPCSHAKIHLKSAPQKLNFVMGKAILKSCTLDCSCNCLCTLRIVTHINAASFLIKTNLCETNNILFPKNY